MQLQVLLRLVRLPDWAKNVFVLLPAFFGGKLAVLWQNAQTGFAFLAFCFISGTVYIINDSCDTEADRLHPEKKHRPVSAGLVSPRKATLIASVLAAAGFTCGIFSGYESCFMLLIYLATNLAYSFFLKQIPVLDILIVASGFLLRIMAGGAASGVEISGWLYLMVFLLALGIALGKRYDDLLLISKGTSPAIRASIGGYHMQRTSLAIGGIFGTIFIAYVLYTCSGEIRARLHSSLVVITAIPVFAGLARYIYIALILKKSGSPVNLLFRDRWLQLCMLCWFGIFAWFLYR